jgi:CheY-like chemotaxis protein
MKKEIVARVEDLMFRSKIDAAARHLNVTVRFAEKADDLARACSGEPAALLVEVTPAALEAVAALKKSAAGRDLPVVGFLSHVDRDLAEEARRLGIDRVLPRSQFSETLPELILEYTAPGVERVVEEEPELPEE